jgi:hypothetical protein
MKSRISIGVVVAMVAALLALQATPASAGTGSVFASYVSSTGTLSVSGTSIGEAVAADDGDFVQMAPNATVAMDFPPGVYAVPDGTSAPDLTVYTYDTLYPASAGVSVYVKSNTNAWVSLGVFSDASGDIGLNLEGVGIINEVKILQDGYYIEPTYPTLGFDLNAVSAEHTTTLTEAAGECATPGTYTGWVFKDWTQFVSAETGGVVTTDPLVAGIGYRFEATGLYSGGPAGGPGTEILADARYSLRVVGQTTPTDAVFGYESYGPTLLDLLLDGAAADWQGTVFNNSHTYTADRVGAGTPAEFDFNVYDISSAYGNNIGGLCVSLYEKDSDGDGIPDSVDNCNNLQPYAVKFLAPFDGSSQSNLMGNTMKSGRVVPVKVTIYNQCTGMFLTDPSANVTIALKVATAIPDDNDAVEVYADPGASNGNTLNFRFADGFWIYNLDSRTVLDGSPLAVGTQYKIDIWVNSVKATTSQWALLTPKK